MSIVERAIRRMRAESRAAPAPSPAGGLLRGARERMPSVAAASAQERSADRAQPITLTTESVVNFAPPAGDYIATAWQMHSDPVLTSQLRGLRRTLMEQIAKAEYVDRAAVMVITSALPGDGKTFSSVAVARAFAAEQDRQVVLVDADLARRTLTTLFGLAEAPGLADVLAAQQPLPGAIYKTEIGPLWFMPAGRCTTQTADFFSSARMDELLAGLRSWGPEYLFVLDTAPVLAVGETEYAAARADFTALVVRSQVTPRGAVEDAVRKLGAQGRLGLISNGNSLGSSGEYNEYAKSYGER
jgi:protein-tyrosine kinase